MATKVAAALLAATAPTFVYANRDSRLWFNRAAEVWTEALPIGNGRLGAMIFGRPSSETLQINEESVWSGGFRSRLNQNASLAVSQVRQLLFEEKVEEAEQLANLGMVSTPQSQRHYETLGNIEMYFDAGFDDYTNGSYERWLDLETATAGVHFDVNGTRIDRELFASAPDDVMVHRLTADGPGRLAFQTRMNRQSDDINTPFDRGYNSGGDTVYMLGAAGGSVNPIEFAGGMTIQTDGTLQTWGEFLVVENATEAVIMFTASTSFRVKDSVAEIDSILASAKGQTYDELRQRHIDDYQGIYDTCSIDLGNPNTNSTAADLPTDQRLNATQAGATDPGLVALTFEYGRYLLISSSRPGNLPANLQGIWNADYFSRWGSKYTININTEMNYWPADLTNMHTLQYPLFDLIEKVRLNGEVVARDMYNASGWVVHHNTDLHGDAAPQDRYPPASFWTLSSAWLCTHILEHYFHTGNDSFLIEKLPTLQGAIQFYIDTLQPYTMNGTDYLVTNPSTSPENTYYTAANASGSMTFGPEGDFQILREFMQGFTYAVSLLPSDSDAIDPSFLSSINETVSRFPPTQISTRYPGVIQEWIYDYEEAEPGHRHISHLYALYPGTQFPPPGAAGHNETLWTAARRTLDYRLENGGAETGWSRAWTINAFARLLDAEDFWENIFQFFNQSAYPNLFDAHPPFQIDGNFGFVAGVAEGLMQSHFLDGEVREIWLLPALPESWSQGSVSGLVARGSFVVGVEWEENRVSRVEVESRLGGRVRFNVDVVRAGGASVTPEDGVEFESEEEGWFEFDTERGGKYAFDVTWE